MERSVSAGASSSSSSPEPKDVVASERTPQTSVGSSSEQNVKESSVSPGDDEWMSSYIDEIISGDPSVPEPTLNHPMIIPAELLQVPWFSSPFANGTTFQPGFTSHWNNSSMNGNFFLPRPYGATPAFMPVQWAVPPVHMRMPMPMGPFGDLYRPSSLMPPPLGFGGLYPPMQPPFGSPPAVGFGDVYPPMQPPFGSSPGGFHYRPHHHPHVWAPPALAPLGFSSGVTTASTWTNAVPINNPPINASFDEHPDPPPTSTDPTVVEQKIQNYVSFAKFDTVEELPDHHFRNIYSHRQTLAKSFVKKIQAEWRILEKDLPDEIFVRACETKLNLLRAVIIGAKGTPYHDGLYFFDILLLTDYPKSPPLVHYRSGGLRINPNLYETGKVCLSLLNTWEGDKNEKWVPGRSTLLQVLVSIQGLVLNAEPFFNEPGFSNTAGPWGDQRSRDYNEKIFLLSLRTMTYNMRRPPKHFEDFVVGHFCTHADDILAACRSYMFGARVGSWAGWPVDNRGYGSCSPQFRADLGPLVQVLANTLSQIGAKVSV